MGVWGVWGVPNFLNFLNSPNFPNFANLLNLPKNQKKHPTDCSAGCWVDHLGIDPDR